MPESMHQRYDRDERRMVATASEELWTDGLVDALVDEAAPILEGAEWYGAPEEAPPRWSARSTAILSLAALALRASRAVALVVRAGYAPEAHAPYRRLQEAAGHASKVAFDASGQYAENWIHGRGQAGKPRAAFSAASEDDPLWGLMSGQAHASFEHYAGLSATLSEDGRLIHFLGPRRDPIWDNVFLWLVAHRLRTVLEAVLKIHSHVDQGSFLTAAQQVENAHDRLGAELMAAMAPD